MEENKKQVPKRRFKEFQNADAWEQRKLSSIADQTYGGGTPRTSVDEFWNGDIPWIQSSDLTDGEVFGVVPNKMISASGLKNSATKLVPENSIAIITRVGVGKLALMPFAYATSQDFLSLCKLNIDPCFGVYSCYKKLQSELHAVQGTSIKGIKKDELLEKDISVPSINEQEQIGQFFQSLDNLITLHQRKLEKAISLKSAYLSEMFPQEGERVPKRRFDGFNDAWEQRKLGDISDIKTGPFGSKLHADDYVNNGTPIITTEHFKSGELSNQKNGIPQVSEEDLCRLQNYVLRAGDIVFSRVGSVDINALITPFQSGWLFSGRVLRVRTNDSIDSRYLHYELSTARVRNDVIGRAVGQTMPSINTEILKKTTVYLPIEIEEQKEIAAFLLHLDDLIILHQRKLEKLKNIKKAFLNEMFI